MTRRWTGWLAWGALALIIGVPSADFALKTNQDNAGSDRAGAFIGVSDGPAKTIIGANRSVDTFSAPFKAGGTQVESADSAPTAEPDQQVARVDPGQVRVVGGAPIFNRGYSPDDVSGANKPQTQAVTKVPEAMPSTSNGIAADVPEVVVLRGDAPIKAAQDEAMVATVESPLVEISEVAPPMVAPVPMPASLRPKSPIVVSSVESAPVYERAQPLVTGSMPPMQPSGSIVALPMADDPDYAADSSFYRTWVGSEPPRPSVGFRRHGSFEEQLPARRGNGVRMDLLQ